MAVDVKLLLRIFIDCTFIFDTTASKHLRELKLIIDKLDTIKKYHQNRITNITWLRSRKKIAGNIHLDDGNSTYLGVMKTGRRRCHRKWVCKNVSSLSEK